jgi:hypothetical protein
MDSGTFLSEIRIKTKQDLHQVKVYVDGRYYLKVS